MFILNSMLFKIQITLRNASRWFFKQNVKKVNATSFDLSTLKFTLSRIRFNREIVFYLIE